MQKSQNSSYDVIVAGAGAAGILAALSAAENGANVLLLEKLSDIAAKLKATGGGRCNLTNTLSNEAFMERFGRNGRFMTPALEALDHQALITFFERIGVPSHAPDGYRVFPLSHSALTVVNALKQEIERLNISLKTSVKAEKVILESGRITGLRTTSGDFYAPVVILATGGMGYPLLGAEGDGYAIASAVGHGRTELYPAMMPLHTKESWVESCRADTIPKAEIRIDLPKAGKIRLFGDLIFTRNGIRGPVVLDAAREINPFLQKYGEVPILINMTKGMNEDRIIRHLKEQIQKHPDLPILNHITTLLPESVARAVCTIADADPETHFNRLQGSVRDRLIKTLAWTPLTVTGHDGFKMAMITRGGISLKEIDPASMESKIVPGLYFCGEIVDLDGPCGGYNLQWAFSSGYLAGMASHNQAIYNRNSSHNLLK